MIIYKDLLPREKVIDHSIKYDELKKCFLDMADCLITQKVELAEKQAKETGKSFKFCLQEIERAACLLRYGAKYIDEKYKLKNIEYGSFKGTYIKKHICANVVLAISTFSSPYNSFIHKMMGVLLAGGIMYFKPSPKAYNCSLALYELIEKILEKYKLYNIHFLAGIKDDEMKSILKNLSFDIILFTGKSETARKIKNTIPQIQGIYETGSSALAYVSNNYDLRQLEKKLCYAGFAQSGMRCVALKNVFIHEAVYDKVKKILKEDVKKLVIGEAEHIDTDIGPIKDANTRRELFEYIKLLESSGYNTLIGGEIKEEFLLPTILEDKGEKTKLSIQEMYGPVMVLHKVKSFHDICVEYYKRSSLQSSIYSNDSHEVMEFVNYNKWCGNICVNYGPALRIDSLPFGGLFDENEGKECLDNIVKIVAKEQLVIQEGNNEEIL